jgi:Ni/Co efflux regulator RcnB
MIRFVTTLVAVLVGGAAMLATPSDAQAQLFHRHHHHGSYSYQPQHYHDSAGHVVDRAGHHVDSYGRHTGSVGLYDNHSVPNTYGTPYTANYGGYNSGAYGTFAVAPNRAPDFGLPIIVVCPDSISTPINYSLNGVRYTLRPGEWQSLVNDRSWVVQFDRGGEYGLARYGLTPGTYEFTATPQGWELLRDTNPQVAPTLLPAPNPPVPTPMLRTP